MGARAVAALALGRQQQAARRQPGDAAAAAGGVAAPRGGQHELRLPGLPAVPALPQAGAAALRQPGFLRAVPALPVGAPHLDAPQPAPARADARLSAGRCMRAKKRSKKSVTSSPNGVIT